MSTCALFLASQQLEVVTNSSMYLPLHDIRRIFCNKSPYLASLLFSIHYLRTEVHSLLTQLLPLFFQFLHLLHGIFLFANVRLQRGLEIVYNIILWRNIMENLNSFIALYAVLIFQRLFTTLRVVFIPIFIVNITKKSFFPLLLVVNFPLF